MDLPENLNIQDIKPLKKVIKKRIVLRKIEKVAKPKVLKLVKKKVVKKILPPVKPKKSG
jgi:hypothetical protein